MAFLGWRWILLPRRNSPAAWVDVLPVPRLSDHKYKGGHAVIAAGSQMTGATQLAAQVARRVGAGLLTIAAPAKVAGIFRTAMPGVECLIVMAQRNFSMD